MGLFSSLFGKGKSSSTNSAPSANKVQGNTLRYFTNNPSEEMFSAARCENGVVYCCANSEFVVGSYEKNEEGKIIVWNDDHTCKIGEIHEEDREIWLTTLDSYIKIKEIRPYVQMPSSFILPAAQWFGNNIADKDTRQTVASFQGDAVAAAAAFVCLTYEVLMYNKYYEYFHGWTK